MKKYCSKKKNLQLETLTINYRNPSFWIKKKSRENWGKKVCNWQAIVLEEKGNIVINGMMTLHLQNTHEKISCNFFTPPIPFHPPARILRQIDDTTIWYSAVWQQNPANTAGKVRGRRKKRSFLSSCWKQQGKAEGEKKKLCRYFYNIEHIALFCAHKLWLNGSHKNCKSKKVKKWKWR